MLTFQGEPVQASIAEATGEHVDLPLHASDDLEANLIAQVERIRPDPRIKDVPALEFRMDWLPDLQARHGISLG